MTAYYEIPLTPTQQQFNISLGGTEYKIALKYLNVEGGGWILDIGDSSGSALVTGIPLVTGVNLLEQYSHLGFAGSLWVQTSGDPDAVPTYANLGTEAHLYWVTEE